MKTLDYVDALRARYSVSDYKLAPMLGIGKTAISAYRTRGVTFDDATALRAAELLDVHPAEVLANIHAERAKGLAPDPCPSRTWHRSCAA